MDAILQWLRAHPALLSALFTLSLAVFVGSLVAVPLIVARLPEDYFMPGVPRAGSHRGHVLWRASRNVVGAILILAGLAMLVLPGQGVLTMLVGLLLMNFPGKRRMVRRLAANGSVRSGLNWMRKRANKPALRWPDQR